MLPKHAPPRVLNSYKATFSVNQFLLKYREWIRNADNNAYDFALGNPHEMPLPEFIEALRKATTPKNKNWYAYKLNTSKAVHTVAKSLQRHLGLPFEPQDIIMTNGATGAMDVIFHTLLDAGDEVIFNSHPGSSTKI